VGMVRNRGKGCFIWKKENKFFDVVFLRDKKMVKMEYDNLDFCFVLLFTSVIAKEKTTNSSRESKAKNIRVFP